MSPGLKILLAADTAGHTTGYYVVARGLRDAGFEVVLGGHLVPRRIAEVAVEEDIDAIGYRIMDGAPEILVPMLMDALKAHGAGGVPVIIGGIVPPHLIPRLKELGVREVFTPGAPLPAIVEWLREHCSV
ncbi:MAG: cobalamin B12-binding domain-containing protein [Candidatus Rokubacteria bacterium]|nr:cobalamin B12-binding domain-containing protein [Candidatus Rokubacteria bacterium]